MKSTWIGLIALTTGLASFNSQAVVIIEPDDYPGGTILNHIVPEVSLITAIQDNSPVFDLTAEALATPNIPAPTGNNVFAHVGIPFFTNERRLRMDFNGLVSSISIIFQGVEWAAVGRLEAYDPYGNLLANYDTATVQSGQYETMSITRENPDVAMAVAYPSVGAWGRLDHLEFTEPVPEPSSLALLGSSALIAVLAWKRQRWQKD